MVREGGEKLTLSERVRARQERHDLDDIVVFGFRLGLFRNCLDRTHYGHDLLLVRIRRQLDPELQPPLRIGSVSRKDAQVRF